MDYTLAKRLSDAGWPQPEVSPDPDENLHPGKHVFGHDDFDAKMVYVPTTDELIDDLPRGYDGYALTVTADIWRGGFKAGYPTKYAWGNTLETALAELWLTPEVQAELKAKPAIASAWNGSSYTLPVNEAFCENCGTVSTDGACHCTEAGSTPQWRPHDRKAMDRIDELRRQLDAANRCAIEFEGMAFAFNRENLELRTKLAASKRGG
jgi:hypothetical protein